MLVHSNLDDGFAGLFADVSSALGMALVEKYIVEDLIGGGRFDCEAQSRVSFWTG